MAAALIPMVTNFETLLVSKDDGIARVSLNRPQVRNAINQRMQEELRDLWHDLRYDDDVRCIVLTAEGESFCTGIDRGEAISEANTDALAAGNYPGFRRYRRPGAARLIGGGDALYLSPARASAPCREHAWRRCRLPGRSSSSATSGSATSGWASAMP